MPNDFFEYIKMSPNAIVFLNENLKITVASKPVYPIFGLTKLLAGRRSGELSERFAKCKDLVLKSRQAIKLLKRTGSQHSTTWQYQQKVYEITFMAFREKGHRYYCLNFIDTTYLYKTETPFELSTSYLNDISNSLPVGITVLDSSQYIFSVNSTQVELFKHFDPEISIENLLGFKVGEVFPVCDFLVWEDVVDSVLDLDEGESLQFIDESSGSFYQYTVSPFFNSSANEKGVIIVSEDITEKSNMENDLKISEEKATRLKTLEEINISLRHEIFNVITPLSMNAELIKYSLDPEKNKDEIEMADSIIESSTRLASFVERLASLDEVSTTDYIHGEETMLNY